MTTGETVVMILIFVWVVGLITKDVFFPRRSILDDATWWAENYRWDVVNHRPLPGHPNYREPS